MGHSLCSGIVLKNSMLALNRQKVLTMSPANHILIPSSDLLRSPGGDGRLVRVLRRAGERERGESI